MMNIVNKSKLKGAIAEAGYSQKELAKEIGISENTLSLKIKGERMFSVNEATVICNILGIEDFKKKCEIFLS